MVIQAKNLISFLSSGTVAYSPQITNGMTLTTAGGGTLTFTTNVSGHPISFVALL